MKPIFPALALLLTLGGCGLFDTEENAEAFGVLLGYGFVDASVRIVVDDTVLFDDVVEDDGMEGLLYYLVGVAAEPRWGRRTVSISVNGEAYTTTVEAREITSVIAERTVSGVRFDVVHGRLVIEG